MVRSFAGTLGKVKYDSSSLAGKVALRLWLLRLLEAEGVVPVIADLYGPFGAMWRQVYQNRCYVGSTGDAVKWLRTEDISGINFFDLDPYGSPWGAMNIIA